MSSYRSPFVHWERTAAVRGFQSEPFDWDMQGLWVPPGHLALVPNAEFTELLSGPAGAALMLGHLHFTARLERELIAPVCSRLASGYWLEGAGLAEDALRLQCDESYHALVCLQLASGVRAQANIEQPLFGEPRFLRRVRELREAAGGCISPEDLNFAAAVVSETIVTRTLGEDWRDPTVRGPIRSFLKMHHLDEARHGAFFSQALRLAWRSWNEETRSGVESVWDDLVEGFAGPDLEMMAVAFEAGGVDYSRAAEILEALETESDRVAATADTRLTRRALSAAQAGAGLGVAA